MLSLSYVFCNVKQIRPYFEAHLIQFLIFEEVTAEVL